MKKQKWVRKGLAVFLVIAMIVRLVPDVGILPVSAAEAQEASQETTGDSSAPAAAETTGQETQRDWRENVLIGNNNAGNRSPFSDKNYTVGISDVCDGKPDTEVLMLKDPSDNANLRYFEIWFTEGLKDGVTEYPDYIPISESKVIPTTIAGFSVTTSSKTTEHGEKSLPQGGVRTEIKLNDQLLEEQPSWDKADWPYANGLTTSYLFDEPITCNSILLFFDDPTANDIYVGDIDLLMPCSVNHHEDDGQGHKEGFTFQGEYPADCQHGGYKIEKCNECGYARRYDIVPAGGGTWWMRRQESVPAATMSLRNRSALMAYIRLKMRGSLTILRRW